MSGILRGILGVIFCDKGVKERVRGTLSGNERGVRGIIE